MSELTTEQKLQAIIEAQKKQGCNRWEGMADDTFIYIDGSIETLDEKRTMIGHILEILLDPSGLKAAWQKDAQEIGNAIFNEWFSTGGDATATIDTAFSLLPDPR